MTIAPKQQQRESETTPVGERTAVDKLTDDAIKNERAKLQRMITTRTKARAELDVEIAGLKDRDTELLTAQIERLTRQLPIVASVTPQGEQQGGGERCAAMITKNVNVKPPHAATGQRRRAI